MPATWTNLHLSPFVQVPRAKNLHVALLRPFRRVPLPLGTPPVWESLHESPNLHAPRAKWTQGRRLLRALATAVAGGVVAEGAVLLLLLLLVVVEVEVEAAEVAVGVVLEMAAVEVAEVVVVVVSVLLLLLLEEGVAETVAAASCSDRSPTAVSVVAGACASRARI